MNSDPLPQRPESKLIQDALAADGRSIRQVAPLAGITEARWRQLIKGSMTMGGNVVEQTAPAATLARMALVLGLTAADLAKAGRPDAAVQLESLLEGERRGPSAARPQAAPTAGNQSDEIALIYASRTMSAKQKLEAIRKVLELRRQVEEEEAQPAAEAPVDRNESHDAR